MSTIKVIQAVYASENRGVDVTSQCQDQVNNGNDDITVDDVIKNIPNFDYGNDKSLLITYELSNRPGEEFAMACGESATLDLIPSTSKGLLPAMLPPTTSMLKFDVKSAYFATENGLSIDVKAECETLLKKNGGDKIPLLDTGFVLPLGVPGTWRLLITYTNLGDVKEGYIAAVLSPTKTITLTTVV